MNRLFQSDDLKLMGQGTESFNASLLVNINLKSITQKLGPVNLTLDVLIDSGKVDIKRIEFRIT